MTTSCSMPCRASQPSRMRSWASPCGPPCWGHAVVGPHLGQRPQPRRLADAAAVGVAVVEAAQPARGDPAVLRLVGADPRRLGALARVGQVGEGRQQDGVRRRRAPGRARDRDRDPIDHAAGLELERVDPGPQRGRQLDRMGRGPAEVVDGVGVEAHRPVLLGRQAPVMDVSAPRLAGDRAQRAIDAAAVQAQRPRVDRPPAAALAQRPARDRELALRSGAHHRRVELAVEVGADGCRPPLRPDQQLARGRPGSRERAGPRALLDHRQPLSPAARVGERDGRRARIEGGLEPGPAAGLDGDLSGDRRRARPPRRPRSAAGRRRRAPGPIRRPRPRSRSAPAAGRRGPRARSTGRPRPRARRPDAGPGGGGPARRSRARPRAGRPAPGAPPPPRPGHPPGGRPAAPPARRRPRP